MLFLCMLAAAMFAVQTETPMPRDLNLAELNDRLAAILRSSQGRRQARRHGDPAGAGHVSQAGELRAEPGPGRPRRPLVQLLPDIQICITNARCIALIAGERANWAAAGDNLFIDLDLSPANCPPGTRPAIGTAVIEITDAPHDGCRKFIARYGRDACVFVNTGDGKRLRLREIYGRVVQDGRVSVGDVVRKLVD